MTTHFKIGSIYTSSHSATMFILETLVDAQDEQVLIASRLDDVSRPLPVAAGGIYLHKHIIRHHTPMMVLDHFNIADISMRKCQILALRLGIPDPGVSPADFAMRFGGGGAGYVACIKVLAGEKVGWRRAAISGDQSLVSKERREEFANILTGEIMWGIW